MPEGRREMTVRVRLTRSGFPTIIPTFHRRIIERRDDRADRWVRIYLSWLTVGRIVELAKPVTRELFASITEDAPGPEEVGPMAYGCDPVGCLSAIFPGSPLYP